VNRLPESVKAKVTAMTLLGPSAATSFEFHVTNWLFAGGTHGIRFGRKSSTHRLL
jgi:type IV secretory pathway VirJ component